MSRRRTKTEVPTDLAVCEGGRGIRRRAETNRRSGADDTVRVGTQSATRLACWRGSWLGWLAGSDLLFLWLAGCFFFDLSWRLVAFLFWGADYTGTSS